MFTRPSVEFLAVTVNVTKEFIDCGLFDVTVKWSNIWLVFTSHVNDVLAYLLVAESVMVNVLEISVLELVTRIDATPLLNVIDEYEAAPFPALLKPLPVHDIVPAGLLTIIVPVPE